MMEIQANQSIQFQPADLFIRQPQRERNAEGPGRAADAQLGSELTEWIERAAALETQSSQSMLDVDWAALDDPETARLAARNMLKWGL